MYNYIAKNYVDKFRVKAVIDQRTNDFCRNAKGELDNNNDIYIVCENGIQVHHWGGNMLWVYIPSIMRGHNIVKKIYAEFINENNVDKSESIIERKPDNAENPSNTVKKETITILDKNIFKEDLKNKNNIIVDIQEDDSEVWFKVRDKDFDKIVPYIKPLTNGKSISPFSSRNLPKNKKYEYSLDQKEAYNKIISRIPSGDILQIGRMSTRFLTNILTKKLGMDAVSIKNDMKKEMMKTKDYIYFKGYEKDYLDFLDKEIRQIYGD